MFNRALYAGYRPSFAYNLLPKKESQQINTVTTELTAQTHSMGEISNELLSFSKQLKITADTLQVNMQEFKL